MSRNSFWPRHDEIEDGIGSEGEECRPPRKLIALPLKPLGDGRPIVVDWKEFRAFDARMREMSEAEVTAMVIARHLKERWPYCASIAYRIMDRFFKTGELSPEVAMAIIVAVAESFAVSKVRDATKEEAQASWRWCEARALHPLINSTSTTIDESLRFNELLRRPIENALKNERLALAPGERDAEEVLMVFLWRAVRSQKMTVPGRRSA